MIIDEQEDSAKNKMRRCQSVIILGLFLFMYSLSQKNPRPPPGGVLTMILDGHLK